GRGPPDCHAEGVAPRVPRPVRIDLFVVAVGSAELKAGQSCRRGDSQSPNACSGLSYSMCPVVGVRRIGNSDARQGAAPWTTVLRWSPYTQPFDLSERTCTPLDTSVLQC